MYPIQRTEFSTAASSQLTITKDFTPPCGRLTVMVCFTVPEYFAAARDYPRVGTGFNLRRILLLRGNYYQSMVSHFR